MLLVPDPDTAVIDPFRQHKTLNLNCFVRDPVTGESYSRDPRYVAKKAEDYLVSTGIADTAYFGPEAEFFIFNDIRFDQNSHEGYYHIDSVEGIWNSGSDEGPNLGFKPRYKEGYFPIPPMDHFQDLRSEMILTMEKMGIEIEVQHHEVGTAGQAEIDMRFDTLPTMADKLMLYKYVREERGPGQRLYRHFHAQAACSRTTGRACTSTRSLWKGGEPLFYSEVGYAGLSRHGRWYIGGLAEARPGHPGLRRPDHQQLQAPGPRLRGAGQPGVQPAQPLGRLPDPAVLQEPQGQAGGVPLPRPVLQPLPGLLGHLDGRSRRRPEQDRAARPGGQGPLRPAPRGAGPGAPGAGLAARSPWPPWRPTTSSCRPAACSPTTSSRRGSTTSASTRSTRSASGPTPGSSTSTTTYKALSCFYVVQEALLGHERDHVRAGRRGGVSLSGPVPSLLWLEAWCSRAGTGGRARLAPGPNRSVPNRHRAAIPPAGQPAP